MPIQTYRIDPAVQDELDRAAKKRGVSRTLLVREALSEVGVTGLTVTEWSGFTVMVAARGLLDRMAASKLTRLEKLKRLESALSDHGDPLKGRELFFGAKTGCFF